MVEIKNGYKLALYLPLSVALNFLIIQVFVERRSDSAFDSFYFYYCLAATGYYLGKALIFLVLYLTQRGARYLADIADGEWPTLTVIVPAYNEEDVIGATLKSLIKVDYPDLRIIVVDDGSTDQTGEIVKALHQDNILYLRQENGGKAQALTYGITQVKTEYTLMVDADCLFPAHTFKLAMRYMVFHGDDATGGALSVANLHSPVSRMQVLEYAADTLRLRCFLSRFQWWKADRTQEVIPGALGLFRTVVLKRAGPLCGTVLAEDVELTARLVERNCRLSFCPYLVCETVVPETLMALNKQRKRWVQGYLQVVLAQLRRWRYLSSRSRYHLLYMLHRVLTWPFTFVVSWIYAGRAILTHDWYFLVLIFLAQCFPFTLLGLIRFCNYDLKSHVVYSFVYSYFLFFNRTYYHIQLLFRPHPRWEKYNRFAPSPKS